MWRALWCFGGNAYCGVVGAVVGAMKWNVYGDICQCCGTQIVCYMLHNTQYVPYRDFFRQISGQQI